jgi:hypothetical protein
MAHRAGAVGWLLIAFPAMAGQAGMRRPPGGCLPQR